MLDMAPRGHVSRFIGEMSHYRGRLLTLKNTRASHVTRVPDAILFAWRNDRQTFGSVLPEQVAMAP